MTASILEDEDGDVAMSVMTLTTMRKDDMTFAGDPNEDDDDEDDDHDEDDDDNDEEGDDIAQSVVNTPIYNIIPGVIAVLYCR